MQRFVKVGTLTILDVEGKPHVFKGKAGPEVTIRLRDRKLYRSLFLHPELKAGEAYVDGTLTIEKGTIRDFLTLSVMNARNLRKHPLQKLLNSGLKRMRKLHQRNTTKAARAHVHHHYDLSNELYKLFLDKDMNYSCAYFAKASDT
ncbi:MAG TPA: class I SAM-dependent methyltransferase, partial [Aestuariivirga sp.]